MLNKYQLNEGYKNKEINKPVKPFLTSVKPTDGKFPYGELGQGIDAADASFRPPGRGECDRHQAGSQGAAETQRGWDSPADRGSEELSEGEIY